MKINYKIKKNDSIRTAGHSGCKLMNKVEGPEAHHPNHPRDQKFGMLDDSRNLR